MVKKYIKLIIMSSSVFFFLIIVIMILNRNNHNYFEEKNLIRKDKILLKEEDKNEKLKNSINLIWVLEKEKNEEGKKEEKNTKKISEKQKKIEEKIKLYNKSLKSKEKILKRAKIKKDIDWIKVKLPSYELFRLAWTYEKNLDYRLSILNEDEKWKDKYIVIPSIGLVMPLIYLEKNSKDYNKFKNWKSIDFNKYLENWAFEIPGTSKNWYWEYGNKVIAWHSSFWEDKPWRYKTHFQKIIELDYLEQIWIYKKNENWNYDRYIYLTKKSYNTEKDDISILKPSKWKNITLFTCTPIWWSDSRWVVKWDFIIKN